MINSMIIDRKDDVIVAIEEINKNDTVTYIQNDIKHEITALNNITIYHKIAIRDIKKGEAICKYGEHIGIASKNIRIGEHVHVHNVADNRENLQD